MSSQPETPRKGFTVNQTLLFMVYLSLISAIILSVLASALRQPQEVAKELDRSKEMLKAAQILNHEGYFQLPDKSGEFVPAKEVGDGRLDYVDGVVWPSNSQILSVYNRLLVPLLTNDKGDITTFKEAGIDQDKYIEEYKKTGYYKQPWMLFYKILPNPSADAKPDEKVEPVGYIIPINGYGLWDAIYGYIAFKPDGDTIIGISWYDQKETPGLGAVITEWGWQSQFPGKVLFQPSADGQTDFKTAPIGITVVRGKVSEVFGSAPRAKNSVDGIAGATLTGNGVNDAYKQVLGPYRPFLIKLHDSYKEHDGK